MAHGIEDTEEHERDLNPHRDEQLEAAMAETADRLRRRGVKVSRRERPEELADLLTAIERYETAFEAKGGDLMVENGLPLRRRGENTPSFIARIDAARAELFRAGVHLKRST